MTKTLKHILIALAAIAISALAIFFMIFYPSLGDTGSAPSLTTADTNTEYTSGETIDLTGKSGTISITKPGEYYLTGTLQDGYIHIDAGTVGNVHIFLDNVSITSSDYAPIFVEQADKTIITLVEDSTNTLTDGSIRTNLVEDEPDGALFSKDDLTLNGTGSLTVRANYSDGIVSKDGLIIASGNITVVAKDHGLRGTDSATIAGGSLTITSGQDGIHSNGEIIISDGTVAISAGDDGVHADTKLTVSGGTIDITKSYEGLESTEVNIDGGLIKIIANDDGINAAGGANQTGDQRDRFSSSTGTINITNGTIHVDAQGDGIDSNGNINMSGGEVYVNGPSNNANGALDFDGTFNITGGLLIAVGASGMAQTPSTSSTQYSLAVGINASADSTIKLTDSSGNTLASLTTVRTAQTIIISSPSITKGSSYTLYVNDSLSRTITATNIITTANFNTGGGGMGNPGGMR